MNPLQFALLPAWVDVRLVSYAVNRPGFRTTHVTVATMLDPCRWSDADVAALYGRRWEIETCFAHLKTTMGMNMLKCKTVEGVRKELAMYVLAYNLIRLAMLKAAARQGKSKGSGKFKGSGGKFKGSGGKFKGSGGKFKGSGVLSKTPDPLEFPTP